MQGKEQLSRIAQEALGYAKGADQAEVLINSAESALTRFANNYVHQNVAEQNTGVSVRVVVGKKIGVASSNDLSSEGLKKVAANALEIARFQLENEDFVSLPSPVSEQPQDVMRGYIEATANASPEMRAAAVATICKKAAENNLVASGAFSTEGYEIAIANSLGVAAYMPYTAANILTVVMGDDSSGYADFTASDVRQINAEAVGDEAVGKAVRSRGPQVIEAGEYDVILEPYAVADIIEYMSYVGFSGLALQEGRSFMRIGEKITGDNITLLDDGLSPETLQIPYDFEGMPRQLFTLIENGVARGVAYDSYTANKEGKPAMNNGHALPAPNTFGPMPLNLALKAGTASSQEMIAGIKRGLYITRFHYMNIVQPVPPMLTGMTRDGTFMIEDGQITYPVRNLRFTQDALAALAHAEMIGKERKLQKGFFGGTLVPALLIRGFNFTGVTKF